MTPHIPSFYKAVFQYWDPACALWGASMCLFTRDYLLTNFFDSTTFTRDAAHDMLLYHQGGALVGCAILNGWMLRRSNDLGVWKSAQAAILAIDIAILAGTVEVFGYQGRLSPLAWRAADWVGILITVGVTVARVAFIAGFGIKAKGKTG